MTRPPWQESEPDERPKPDPGPGVSWDKLPPEPGERFESKSGHTVVEVTGVDGARVEYDYLRPPGREGYATVGSFRKHFEAVDGAGVSFTGP